MLKNGTFTEGWTNLPPAPGFLINQQPNHWTLTWLQPGESLYDDPAVQAMGVPECVHKLAEQLPPNEQPGQPNALILEGDSTFKIFHAFNTFGATLSQTVSGLEPNSTAVLRVPIQAHLHGAIDQSAAESGVWVNGEGGWINGSEMGDKVWFYHTLTFTVLADGTADIFIRVKSKWPSPIDFFIDGITLTDEIDVEPDSAPISTKVIELLDGSSPGQVKLVLREEIGSQWFTRARLTRTFQGKTELEIVSKPEAIISPFGGGTSSFEPALIGQSVSNTNQRVLGMDISWAQAQKINFEKAADMGVRFCFIRLGSGRQAKDDNFDHNFREAGRVGMLRGIYYYLYPAEDANVGTTAERTPEGQARRFVSLLEADAELGAVVDIEAKNLTPDEVKRFVTTFQALEPYRRPIMIYTAAWFWNISRGFNGADVEWAKNHPLWVAHYTSFSDPVRPSNSFQVAIPGPWTGYTFHQWTSKGGALADQDQVDLDLNYFPGSLTELNGWVRSEYQAGPGEVIGSKFVTAKFGLNMRQQPSGSANINTTLPFGTKVDVLKEGAWDRILFQGESGYAGSDLLATEYPVSDPALDNFAFKVWPTNHKIITQYFGDRPDYYSNLTNGFLPAHEGIDIKAPFGDPYFCVAPGKVIKISDKKNNGKQSAYGWHVVVEHVDGYSTLYAHASADSILVKVGQEVAAGQILAHSGNTGATSGPHLHLTLKKEGYQTPGWPESYLDPWPFLKPLFEALKPPAGNLREGFIYDRNLDVRANNLALTKVNSSLYEKPDSESRLLGIIPSGSSIRVLIDEEKNDYLFSEASIDLAEQPDSVKDIQWPPELDLLLYIRGDGRQYEVRNASGSQERFRTETVGATFYLLKNAQWEQFYFDNDFIYRDIDTSPGSGRYYRLTDPDRTTGSRWLRRKMSVGQTYTQVRKVQFYEKRSAKVSAPNSGNVTDTMKLVAHHQKLGLRTGLVVNNIIELHWVVSVDDHTPKEKYFYARGFGLVAWDRLHLDPNSPNWSAISEIHAPGTREKIARETINLG